MGCHFLLQQIFPTQGSNPAHPHDRQSLYKLSHQGSLCNKESACQMPKTQGRWAQSLGQEDPLEEEEWHLAAIFLSGTNPWRKEPSVSQGRTRLSTPENGIRSHRLKPKFSKNSFLLLLMTTKSTDYHLGFWPAINKKLPGLHQFRSVAQSCLTLCDPMDCSTPGLPVHHQLPESTQTHVHWVNDAIQPSHPLSSPSPPALNLSQHQGLSKGVSSRQKVAKVLEFQLQHQSFQSIFRTDFL